MQSRASIMTGPLFIGSYKCIDELDEIEPIISSVILLLVWVWFFVYELTCAIYLWF